VTVKHTSISAGVDCELPITCDFTVSASFLNSATVRSWFYAATH